MQSLCRSCTIITLLSAVVCATACASGPQVQVAAASAVPDPALGYTTETTGDLHDFDEFAGGWAFKNWRLKKRNVGSKDYDEFTAVSCTGVLLDGVANVDEVYFPSKGWSGVTLRTFNIAKKQWSIYWVNSRDGVLFPPVLGGFKGSEGYFYGEDTDEGKPVKVRFHWTKLSRDKLKWEQAFSYDNKTWEVNWINVLERVDEATTCDHGRPRRDSPAATAPAAAPSPPP
jgi:hypothetical protein